MGARPRTEPAPVTVASPDEIDDYEARERLRGRCEGLAEAGLGLADLSVVNATGNSRGRVPTPPGTCSTAFPGPPRTWRSPTCSCSAYWTRCWRAACGRGRDVSVVGFDDLPEAEVAGLTTVRQ